MTPAPAFTFTWTAEPWTPPAPTAAELLAIHRCYAMAAALGVQLVYLRALKQQLEELL